LTWRTGGDATYRTDFGRTGQHAWIYRPRRNLGRSQGLIWCHALGQTATTTRTDFPVVDRFLFGLTELGYTVCVPSCGVDTSASGTTSGQASWGNPNAVASVEDARIALGTLPNVDSSTIPIIGMSMGASTALQYTAAYRARVRGLVGIIPATSILSMYTTWGNGGFVVPFFIPNAWGVTYPAALPAAARLDNKTALQGLPARFYYHHDDGVIPTVAADAAAMCSWIGSSAQMFDTGTGNHVPSVIDEAPMEAILGFLCEVAPPR
jgi:pimeloyl-ACP methyl ester carboxylesterase